MSLLRKGIEQRSTSSPVTYQRIWGAGFSKEEYFGGTEEAALRLTAVYAAVRIIADGISSLPLLAHKEVKGVRKEKELPELFREGIRRGTLPEWLYQLAMSLALRGNAYGLIVRRTPNGAPAEIIWLHPDEISLAGPNEVMMWGTQPYLWNVNGSLTTDVLHIRNAAVPGRVLGLSPIQAMRETTEFGLAARKFGTELYQNGSIPSGVIETTEAIEEDDAVAIKDRFKQAVKGRDVAVMGLGATYKPITINPVDAQFLEVNQYNATQIAAVFGVEPEDIGGTTGESMTYANAEMKAQRRAAFTLRPYMVKIEAAFSLACNVEIRFNPDAMIRTNTKERYEAYEIALRSEWLNTNEVRQREDLAPRPGGDVYGKKPEQPTAAQVEQPSDDPNKPQNEDPAKEAEKVPDTGKNRPEGDR